MLAANMTTADTSVENPRDSDVDREDDRDSDSETDERWNRYVETAEDSPELLKGRSQELKPFYNGPVLKQRMKQIRETIYHIRQNWKDYGVYLTELKQMLITEGVEFTDKNAHELYVILVSSRRDWLTPDNASDSEVGYEAVRLYTTQEGHEKIYRLSNNIFRREASLVTEDTIRPLVFLVELINIDLYNYFLKHPQQTDFQGVVYRRICLSAEELDDFRSLKQEAVDSRDIAAPLGLFSASASLPIAKKFIEHQIKNRSAENKKCHPLIIKIHVVGLKPEYAAHYTKRFPISVLTSLCAVDIHKLSYHRKEKEVLLRSFMMSLDLFQDDSILIMEKPCNVLEAVMVNTTRDHISVAYLGDEDDLARTMFTAMVMVCKCEFAVEYCRGKGLSEDADGFEKMLKEHLDTLERVWSC